ncbi:MAG TPA: phosphoenolpyruvate synthase [Kofleriaceae bacterium]|nr:phosphoenolpyruvate synthase [Kofleriaceae bacterium]
MARSGYVWWFEEIGVGDVAFVGGKNASLGELYRELAPHGIRVPNGFAITADGYRRFLAANQLDDQIREALSGLDTRDLDNLRARGQRVRQLILAAELPRELRDAIGSAYRKLAHVDVAVRSSATAEDLPDASFAGQQETYLNVQGEAMLLEAVRRCFASLFTDRAISYRADKKFDQMKIALSVGVQEMVRSDLASSGVMFSLDTETGFRDVVLINASYGLGENVVQGAVNPDEFTVHKPTLLAGFRPIVQKTVGNKEFKLVYDAGGGKQVKNVPVAPEDRARFAISDDDILVLARWACAIEQHYGRPMDMEWAKDGRTGELFIVQARPETVQSQKQRQPDKLRVYRLRERGRELVRGHAVGDKIASGPARVIKDVQELGLLQPGEILVTDKTDPDWEPAMKHAAAIVTNRGGRTAHAAIVSRELGIPAVVGTMTGTDVLKTGQAVTVSCAEGDVGVVYDGAVPFGVQEIDVALAARPRTKVMMNVADPDEALALSFTPNDGVGLARMELIINNFIRIHPMALVEYGKQPAAVAAEIDRQTAGYADKPSFFVDRLAQGVAMIAAAFYPKDVIVRMSDFKTNEYANLIGGAAYEPKEENPMLGFRGASRYYDPRYRDGFALECRAMKKVRDEMGLANVKLMIPFCRTVDEANKVLAEMGKHGLVRGERGLEVYVMCEIPSNVILADDFARVFDGFSIGSNDLTQLVLGVDRDSEIVAHVFDERNEAVKRMIATVIRAAHERGRKIGICGQAPSDYPEVARFLVEQGIDSISLNPDAVAKTTLTILDAEH